MLVSARMVDACRVNPNKIPNINRARIILRSAFLLAYGYASVPVVEKGREKAI